MSDVAPKKQIGAYYTPKRAAELLVNWALRDPCDTLLEPSFGGCGFLDMAHQRLKNLGAAEPISQLYGFDIDERAFEELDLLFGNAETKSRTGDQFVKSDFMRANPNSLSKEKHDAIVGNPPYVSYHSMNEEQRKATADFLNNSIPTLDRKASLWAYFVLHALDFLKPGGRVAWVLPGSFLQAEYAADVRNVIAEEFRRSVALLLNERLFLSEGTEENSVLLFAEGWKQDTDDDTLTVGYSETLDEMAQKLDAWRNNQWEGAEYDSRVGISLMDEETRSVMDVIEDRKTTASLGNLVDIKIGIVTGANWFFILDKSTITEKGLRKEDLHFILPKFRLAEGLRLTEEDFEKAYEEGERCLLVKASTGDGLNERVERYFEKFDDEKRASNATFKKRSDWRDPDDPRKPDAFFPYMHQTGPRLVLNDANVNSTNTVHRVYFTSDLFEDGDSSTFQKTIAISLLSTYSQLSAELQGRSYGSGVLKHEPSDARRIKVIVPSLKSKEEVENSFHQIDSHFRRGETEEAEDIANRFVLQKSTLAERSRITQQLKVALQRARDRRSVKKHGD